MRQDLPTGTVTFLFTDVEGSTRLLESVGAESYAEALLAHREIVRSELVEHGGVEVDTQGDAFFCAFGDAQRAVACAERIQLRLMRTPIRVRMGIHSGAALVADDHYVGLDVHRAARIVACGHGGQVVLSPTTVALLEPGSFALRDLGEHRLKDLSAPVRLHQLGEDEFAPLKTLFRTDLPVPATEFLGREEELAEAAEIARRAEVRLLTLTGPGGTGKTRFALQLAGELGDEFPDGLRWVPLAPLRDGALVASAVAETLDVEEEPGAPLQSALAQAVGGKRVLLLLDNCEHVLDAVADVVAPLLRASEHIVVLTTSREAIGVAGEHVYAVQPLTSQDAIDLFATRAVAAGASLEASGDGVVAALCGRLDNLPLAVELAAARAPALPPAAMLEALSERLDLLKGPRDADERHRTLHGAIAWSHDLLEPGEQRLFQRLSVFAGGAPLDSVHAVCDATLDELLSLVAKNLVRTQTEHGAARYWMLETIREFSAVLLEDAGEDDRLRDRHTEWFAALSRASEGSLTGPGAPATLERLERERENLRTAFGWALRRAAESEGRAPPLDADARALAVSLAAIHRHRGRLAEAENALRTAISLSAEPIEAAALESQLGRVLRLRGRPHEGLEAQFVAVHRLEQVSERGDRWWDVWIDVELERARHHYFEGQLDALQLVTDELGPVVEDRADSWRRMEFLHVLALNAYRRERYVLSAKTEALVREIHRIAEEVDDPDAGFTLGFCLLWRSKLDEAITYLRRGLDAARTSGDALIEVRCLVYGALAHRRRGDVEGARALLAELAALDDTLGYTGLVSATRAWVALRDGDAASARAHGEAAVEHWTSRDRSTAGVFQWTARFPLLAVELEEGHADAALEQARAMLDPFQQPLPPDLDETLRSGVDREDPALLGRAVELARTVGYV